MAKTLDITGVSGRYWHRLNDGRLQCDLCPRFCKLREDQRGLCFVRGRANDEIVLTTYGRSATQSLLARHTCAVIRHGRL